MPDANACCKWRERNNECYEVKLRINSKVRRVSTNNLARRMVKMEMSRPAISFSFDDAPKSAFLQGGDILRKYGAKATYFVSLGILGADSPSGVIGSVDDLKNALSEGHELGCHTYDHMHPSETSPRIFEQSVLKNRYALSKIIPEASFKSFSYPISGPNPFTKRRVGRLFDCCRVGVQTYNSGWVDLNYLKGFFLDSRTGVTFDEIRRIIDENMMSKGWLIFATHDIQNNPSNYGCTPNFFDKVVKYSHQSESLLLPVGAIFDYIGNRVN